jgi:type II secretory pathway predicted ATPase ExeA
MDCLRKLRLLFPREATLPRPTRLTWEDFPKNHNLILLAQPGLLNKISLTVHEDIKSRITYSVLLQKLNPDNTAAFILAQLDRVRLPHNTFTDDALALIVRSSEGVLRKTRNLCLSCLLVAVRDQTKTVGLNPAVAGQPRALATTLEGRT